ncbi:MAG: hypothetical protein AB8E82_15485 [Aureispira sp.]
MKEETNTQVFDFEKEVSLTGIYKESILAKKEGAEHLGHYKIVVDASTEVVLIAPYRPESKRSKDEVKQFEGKKVTVTGMVGPTTYLQKPSFSYRASSVNVPCFVSISSIKLAE